MSEFSTEQINSCLKDIDSDLEEVSKGNLTAMRRVRKCLLNLTKECGTMRKKLMDMVKEQQKNNKKKKEEKKALKTSQIIRVDYKPSEKK